MNIFVKRPLCLVLCITICGFLIFSLEIEIFRIALLFISVLLLIISLILRKDKDKAVLTRFCSMALIIASLLSFLYFDCYFKAYNLYDEPVDVEGVVEEISESSSYTTRLRVKAIRINGRYNLTYTFFAYIDKQDSAGIIEGTRISFAANLEGFSEDSKSYNISKGINAYASDVSNLKIVEYTGGDLRAKLENLREYLTRYIISKSGKDSGAIVSALLLGERDYLPDQLRLDFKRIGISHILALSGMHLAVLSLGIEKLLLFLGIGKKIRVGVTAVFVFLYMALTGFSISVVRAGIMLIIASVLYLLSRSKDSLTSLALSVTVICIISPNAIFDISLQLSALATFGIIALSEISSEFDIPITKKERILNYFVIGILASIFAISATMTVSAVNFGGFSILAPITTLIFSFLAEIIMYLGCLMMLIGWLIPLGWLLNPICFIFNKLAGAFSSIKFAYVSSNFSFAFALIIIYSIVFMLFIVVKLKKPLKILNVIIVMFCLVNLLPTIATVTENHKETVAYSSSTKCDEILIRSKNEVCLINSSQYAKNLAYTTLELLEDAKVTYLDKYYLTHYSWSIDDEIEVLLSNVIVDEIYLPAPRNDDENTILKILYKTVEDYRTDIILFSENEDVLIGDYSITLLYSAPYGSTSMNALKIIGKERMYTYISSGLLATAKADDLMSYIAHTDYLILGEHGKKYTDKLYIKEYFENLDGIIINSNNLFLEQDNMRYYLDNECFIYSHPKEIIYLK